jgi:peptide-methionine (S)-S-oxide reductase
VQYRSVVYYTDDEQRLVANKIIADKNVELAGRITTTVEKAPQFWPAEDYHQDYLHKHPGGYTCHYERF